MTFFSKPKSYLGVDFGAGGVKVVELKEEKKRPTLFTYGFTSEAQDIHRLARAAEQSAEKEIDDVVLEESKGIQPDKKPLPPIALGEEKIERYAAILRSVCAKARTVSKVALASLPISAVFHAIVTLPKVEKSEFNAVLAAEVKKLMPYAIDDMVLDFQVLEAFSDEKNKKVMVHAAPKNIVEFFSKVFQRAGLELQALEPESSALERSLIGRDTAVSLVIDMGAERTNFFIIDKSIPIANHTIESGGNKINRLLAERLGLETGAMEQARHDLFENALRPGGALSREAFLKILTPFFDPVVKQIEYSFSLYLSQSGNESKRPEKIILTGGAAMTPYLAGYLADYFKMKCYLGDPWARVVYQDKLKPVLNEIGPRMSVAIGLALKNIV